MDLLCKVCDREIIENEYIASLGKRDDNSIYDNYTIININLDEFDKILNDYINTYNKKFDIYYIKCTFEIEFDNNFIAKIEINYHYNIESNKINSEILFFLIVVN